MREENEVLSAKNKIVKANAKASLASVWSYQK